MAAYAVQKAAAKMGISPHTIRYYENQGMSPFVKRDDNNRILNDMDLEWLHIIISLKTTGMPLHDIKHYQELVVEGEGDGC